MELTSHASQQGCSEVGFIKPIPHNWAKDEDTFVNANLWPFCMMIACKGVKTGQQNN